jgi:signal transduction histidine kinase
MKKIEQINIIDNNFDREEIYPSFSLENLFEKIRFLSDKAKNNSKLLDKNILKKNDHLMIEPDHHVNEAQFEFLSFMSHQFKVPISIIKACVDVLKRTGNYSEEDKMLFQQLYKIDKSILQINELIDTTLGLSKLEDGKLELKYEEFFLEEVFKVLLRRYKDMYPQVIFSFHTKLNNSLLNADKMLIEQIFSNLLSNAIKYSPTNTKVTIEAVIQNNEFIISITDNGIGISDEDGKKLFSKFFRGGNVSDIGGTGIGLYFVKQLIELHLGRISMLSKLEQGTKFTVYLPIINKL